MERGACVAVTLFSIAVWDSSLSSASPQFQQESDLRTKNVASWPWITYSAFLVLFPFIISSLPTYRGNAKRSPCESCAAKLMGISRQLICLLRPCQLPNQTPVFAYLDHLE